MNAALTCEQMYDVGRNRRPREALVTLARGLADTPIAEVADLMADSTPHAPRSYEGGSDDGA